MTRATDLIAAERDRQMTEEGYDAEHDAGGHDGLALAAATYALPRRHHTPNAYLETHYSPAPPATWPWDPRVFKPDADRVRELVKAGALIAAAIDSLLAPVGEP